ncbi:carbohydrate esterase family 8 protein [Paramyrothecium foliicola]|nr:carbohydrate esterase family 8 protein [Paramyrothecium foliicola]
MRLSSVLPGLLAVLSAVQAAPADLVKRASRTSPPAGCLAVGSGQQYGKLQDALKALGSSTNAACIFIYPGTYALSKTEQIKIDYKGALTLYGSTTDTGSYKANSVTFTRNIKSADAGSLDASAVLNVVSANFKMYNINVKNLFGSGAQAVALAANGDKQGYYGCGFYGYQDTLYAKSGKQYYSNCYIEGAVDYIFGAANAWFGECQVASNGNGAITASSRTEKDETWYVFDHSNVRAADGYSTTGKVFLGRPWRVNARVIYQNSGLSNIIHPEGWTTMAEGATPEYREIANTGAGASTSKRKFLTSTTAAVSKNTLWGSDWKTWVDSSY